MKVARRITALLVGANVLAADHTREPYRLDTKYNESNFFSAFDFFSGPDPTHGYVQYVDHDTAFREGIVKLSGNSVFLGVDHHAYNPLGGRKSVRLTSQKRFTHGLIIADISHMPSGTCGVWPAFWMFGPDWPNSGEIDIIEGVNDQTSNTITLHTSPGCYMTMLGEGNGTQTGRKDCSAAGEGCGMETNGGQNFGDAFNNSNGGVYAMEWTSESISVWFFPRHSIPNDVTSSRPDPTTWSRPLTRFIGGNGCNIDSHFSDNNIVFDTTFCGDWAGNPSVWDSNPRCSVSGRSCVQYVANNPLDFVEAYWLIDSVMVYKKTKAVRPTDQSMTPELVSNTQPTTTTTTSVDNNIADGFVPTPPQTLLGR